ncbi:ABC transporter ATP-binding protein [Mahella sp.]|uniref:ABC transporter ATP-binding protein n=1 Tax=Mahella sp. TaxID=2798721 RepID=UPI0025BD4653|nr:ABC transporter ATP-binding protein [Mahella sp.]MBZ4665174.1 transporter ATP-binding protein [Mahella sp.]MDK2902543.1 type transport system ATP-binding protein [Clostridiales bacterium]
MSSFILSFDNVTKKFESVTALKSLSFKVPENKITGLIGSNGAGKTTTLRLIVRYLTPDSGTILYRNKDIYSLPDSSFPISYIPDTPIYFEELTVKEHLSFISAMYQTESNVQNLIDVLKLERHLDKVPSVLSRGTKQKLIIACALLRNFDFLIADEPFSGLDPKQIKTFKDLLLEEKKKGKTILLSTHLLDMIENICDYYIMIDDGELLAQGTLTELINNSKCSTLEELYLYLADC